MRIDERLRTDLAAAAEAVSPPNDALDTARQLGQGVRRRRHAVVGAAVAAVVVLGGALAWSDFGNDPEEGGVLVTDQPTPVATISAEVTPEPSRDADPIFQARIASSPISNRVNPVAVWTGEEVVIWGGLEAAAPVTSVVGSSAGAVYAPSADSWRAIAPDSIGQRDASAVWDGTRIIMWGGTGHCRGFAGEIVTCEPYEGYVSFLDPHRGTTSTESLPPIDLRRGAEAVWTGDRMIVWGGFASSDARAGFSDGGIYDPATDRWEVVPANPFGNNGSAITAFHNNTLIVGVAGRPNPFDLGKEPPWSRYSLDTGEWTELPNSPVTIEAFAAGVQVGDKLVVFNGDVGDPLVKGSGAILDLATDTWTELAGPPDHPDMVDGVAIGNRAVFLTPETGRLLVYDLDLENWSTTWDHGDDTLVGARTLVRAGDTKVMAWNGTTGEGVIVDIAALDVISS